MELFNSLKTILITVSIVLSSFFLIAIIVIVSKVSKTRRHEKPVDNSQSLASLPAEQIKPEVIASRWAEIVRHINSTKDMEWKYAIMEADKLIEHVFKKMGFEGETLGEKLMNLSYDKLSTLDGLWEAHKVRNSIAHDSEYMLRFSDAKRALQLYENSLRELGVL